MFVKRRHSRLFIVLKRDNKVGFKAAGKLRENYLGISAVRAFGCAYRVLTDYLAAAGHAGVHPHTLFRLPLFAPGSIPRKVAFGALVQVGIIVL